MSDWNEALKTVREQMTDYEREGTSTPGKLKRSARLRASRMALRDFAASHPESTAHIKAQLNAVEVAEKDDNWGKISLLIPELLATVAQAGE